MYIKLPIPVRNAVLSLIGLDIVTESTKEFEEDECLSEFGVGITPKMLKHIENEWIERYIIN